MISSPIFVIDDSGISAPLYTDILSWVQDQYRAIYGVDIDLDPDTQDGQFLAILSLGFKQINDSAIATYNAYSPTFAQGTGLSSVVKINGIKRLVPSSSSVVVKLIGQDGTIVTNGLVSDNLNLNSQWLLPATVTIPNTGEIQVTAVSTTPGSVFANIGTITRILNPQPGWQSVTNLSAAIPGAPVESDAALRRRQAISTAGPAQSVRSGIEGAIANVIGVIRVKVYENDSNVTDSDGIPSHSISPVVEGGDIGQVANSIALRKTPGTSTYGTTSQLVTDARGLPSTINFFELALVPITITINLVALPGYSAAIGQLIVTQVMDFINSLPIGYDSYLSKLEAVTQLVGTDGLTYQITSVLQSRIGSPAAADIVIAFNEATDTSLILITLNVS
jgi:uncharacterized phage protein gp47/JayE